MASTQPAQRRAGVFDDIEDWMASRQADVDQAGAAEAAGRDAWNRATRSGHNLPAAQPSDIVALGGRALLSGVEGAGLAPLPNPDQPQEIEEPVEAAARPDFETPRPMDLGFRVVQARPGDSISRMLGTSDPSGIGRFQGLNGLRPGGSTLRAGRNYFVPSHWDDATIDEAAGGRAALVNDNARLAELARSKAETDRQAQLLANSPSDQLPESAVSRGPPLWQTQAAPSNRSWLDDSRAARGFGGTMGYAAGVVPGLARGGWHTVKGMADGAVFAERLLDPLDPFLSRDHDAAWDHVVDAAQSAARYVERGAKNPSLVGDDIAHGYDEFRRENDPTATAMAKTFAGEFGKGFNFGLNHGELAFDTASLLMGGEALGGAAGLGAAAKAADSAELAYLAGRPGLAAYLDEPYSGMGHHIWGRNQPLPSWLGGGLAPKTLLENDLNKIRSGDMTKRDFYRNHVGVDDDYWGGAVARKFGGGGWSGKKLGWGDYGPLDRLNYGTSPQVKAIVGSGLVGGTSDELLRRQVNP